MDKATGDIWAVEFTSSREGESEVLPGLLAQFPSDQPIGTITADGAYDTRKCHSAVVEHGDTAVVPIRRNGRAWKDDCLAARPRNETLRATQRFGRVLWKRLTGYHARSRVETQMQRLKSTGQAHRLPRARPPSRRDPHPHRPNEPLLGPRKGQNHPRRLNLTGKG